MTSQALYDDKMLMMELASGDEEAFKHFYLRNADVVFSLVLTYVKSSDIAKDITQDVFIKVWEKRKHFLNIEHASTYVCNAARNRAIDLQRAKRDRVAHPAPGDRDLSRNFAPKATNMSTEKAILAGGCFWGVEELVRNLPGVVSTVVGYTGGDVRNATYRNHGTHAEAIEIVFNPEVLSYRKLLEFFFQIHDPTTRNRQGNDVGTSYRSAIFYLDARQKETADTLIAEMTASHIWPGAIVTQVVPASDFWVAEEAHQNYLQKYPNGYTCHYVRPNWTMESKTV